MALDFPANPMPNQVYDNYYWDDAAKAWRSSGSTSIPNFLRNPIISTATSTTTPLTVDGVISQSAALQEWRNYQGTVLASMSASGGLTLNNALTVSNGGTGATSFVAGTYLKGNGPSAIQGQSGVPAGDISSGTLSSDRLPAGSIVQVVYGSYSGAEIGNSSSTYADSGLSANITPKYSNSTILIQVSQNFLRNTSYASGAALVRLRRGTTALKDVLAWNMASTAVENNGPVSFAHQDSPGTTSTVNYNTQFANNVNGPVVVANRGMVATMVLMEIKV